MKKEASPVDLSQTCAWTSGFVHGIMERIAETSPDAFHPNAPLPEFPCGDVGEVACKLVARPNEDGKMQTYNANGELQECPKVMAMEQQLREGEDRLLEILRGDTPLDEN